MGFLQGEEALGYSHFSGRKAMARPIFLHSGQWQKPEHLGGNEKRLPFVLVSLQIRIVDAVVLDHGFNFARDEIDD